MMKSIDTLPLGLFSRFGIRRTLLVSIEQFCGQMEAGAPELVVPVQHMFLQGGKCTQGSQSIQ